MSEAPKRVRVTFFTDGEPAAVYYDHEAEGRELFLSAAALRELCEKWRGRKLRGGWESDPQEYVNECADDLEALLEGDE